MMDMTSKLSARKPGSGSDSSGFKAKSVSNTLSDSSFTATTNKSGRLKMAARRPQAQNQRSVVPRVISKPLHKPESLRPDVLQISSAESSPKDTTSELPSDWEAKVGMGTSHTLWSPHGDNKSTLTENLPVDSITVKIDEGDGSFSPTPIIEGGPPTEPLDLCALSPVLDHSSASAQSGTSGNQDPEVSADLITTLENENRALLDTIMELRNSNTLFNEQRQKADMAESMYVHLHQLRLQRSIANFESHKISAEKLVHTFKQHLFELEKIGNKFLEDLPESFGRTEFDEMFSGVKRESKSVELELKAPLAKKFRSGAYTSKVAQA